MDDKLKNLKSICSPDDIVPLITNGILNNTITDIGNESFVEDFIHHSQEANEWIPLGISHDDVSMIDDWIFEKAGQGHCLSEKALRLILEKHPAQKKKSGVMGSVC